MCWNKNHKLLSMATNHDQALKKTCRMKKGNSVFPHSPTLLIKRMRQSLSFTDVQLPPCQMAEREIFAEVLKRCLSEKDLRLFFRWFSNDWMWLTQIISLITAQQALVDNAISAALLNMHLIRLSSQYYLHKKCNDQISRAEILSFWLCSFPLWVLGNLSQKITDLWSLACVKICLKESK